jgi:copper(I)-binding protein
MRKMLLAASLMLAVPVIAPMLAPVAAAHDAGVAVSHAWARATAANAMAGGAFLTLTATHDADKLVGVSSPVAKSVALHETVNDKGVMKMLPVPVLDLPADTAVTLKPGSYHIMLMGLHHQLKQGDSFPLTLTFEHAKPQTVSVTIEGPGAAGPTMHGAMPGMTHKP